MKNPRIPLVAVLFMFLVIAVAGFALRTVHWIDIAPIAYSDLKNAHSHIAFLGWVFPAVMILFERLHGTDGRTSLIDAMVFWSVIVINILMFLSFLRFGYGPPSVILLSIHTILAVIYGIRFWNRLDDGSIEGCTVFSKSAMATMMVSFLGPLAIPIIKNSGFSPTEMKMAIHFYLHFQYNAFFVLSVLAIISKGRKPIPKATIYLLLIGMIGTYFLTIQFGVSKALVQLGMASAIVQAVAVFWVIRTLYDSIRFDTRNSRFEGLVVTIVIGSVLVKILMQLALPAIPQLVVESGIHMWVIAFLHLIFLGAVTPVIVLQMMKEGFLTYCHFNKVMLTLLLAGFFVTEMTLFMQGGVGLFTALPMLPFTKILATGAGLMVLAALSLFIDSMLVAKR